MKVMAMVKELIEQSVEHKRSFRPSRTDLRFLPVVPTSKGIPTLSVGIFRPVTPQLLERYQMFGRWEKATHGHWLGVDDMEAIWQDNLTDGFLAEIKSSRIAGEENWPNDASALFRPERLSLFACSDITNERIYLLWLDFEDEPELWVYDSNGESRYKDLAAYLRVYATGDLSASDRHWKLAEAERA